ncbi:MAG: lysophospholipase [Candidatus Eisenbacteria bacterium]|nr:lysophospholipase [Candidatus Eisenbacteria bacterium]
MNPSEARVPGIQIEVHVDRDTVLPGRVWCADRPRALVAIVHGLGEHSGRYAALAQALVDRHFTVAALDLPGHGEARGARGDAKSWAFLRDQCVPATFTASRGMPGQPPDLRAVLVGHSFGGLLALDYALAHPRQLLALAVSAPSLRSAPPPVWKLGLAQAARVVAPGSGFPHGLPEDGMSRDAEVLELRRDDPLMHDRITPRVYFGMVEARARVMAEARRLAVPTLVMQGMADRVIDPKGALEFNVAAPHGMVRLITYEGAYHEIFNDLDRDRVVKDLVAWLDLAVVV